MPTGPHVCLLMEGNLTENESGEGEGQQGRGTRIPLRIFSSWMNVAISDPYCVTSEVSWGHRLESQSSCKFSILCRQMCPNFSLIFFRPRLWLQILFVTLGNPWTSLILNFLICKETPKPLNLAYLSQRVIMRLKWENTELAFKQIVGWKRVVLTGKSSQTMSSWKVRLVKFKCSVLSTTLCRSTGLGLPRQPGNYWVLSL